MKPLTASGVFVAVVGVILPTWFAPTHRALVAPFVVAGETAYVSNAGNGTVSVIDVLTGQVIATVGDLPSPGVAPFAVAANANAKDVYLASSGDIYWMNPNGLSAPKLITTSAGNIMSLQIGKFGQRAYFGEYSTGTLGVIDTSTNTVTAHIPLTVTVNGSTFNMIPDSVALDPNKPLAYIADGNHDLVGILNLQSQSMISVASVPFSPYQIVVSPNGELLYMRAGLTVAVMSAITNTLIGENRTGLPNNYGNMAISNDGKTLYLPDDTTNTLDFIDASSLNVVTSVPVGTSPADVSLDQSGTHAVVTNNGSGNVSILNLAQRTVVTVPTGPSPRAQGKAVRNQPPACSGDIQRLEILPDSTNVWTLSTLTGYRIIGPAKDLFDVEGINCLGDPISLGVLSYSLTKNGSNITLNPVSGLPEFYLSSQLPSASVATLTVAVTDPSDGKVISRTLSIETSSALYIQTSFGGLHMLVFDNLGNPLPFPSTAFSTTKTFGSMTYDAANGYIYASTTYANKITVWNRAGVLKKTITDARLAEPCGLAIDTRSGDLYVADPDYDGLPGKSPGVLVFNAQGQDITPPGSFKGLKEPVVIRYNPTADALYVYDGKANIMYEFTPQGAVIRETAMQTFTFDYDPVSHQLYATDPNNLSEDIYSEELAFKSNFGNGIVYEPVSTAFDVAMRKLYIVNCCYQNPSNLVLGNEFDGEGNFIRLGINDSFRGMQQDSDPLVVVP